MIDRPAIKQSEIDARRAVVVLARSMLARETTFFEGAFHVLRLKSSVGGVLDRDQDFDVFVAIESETDHLPLKAQRQLWSPQALARLDPEFRRTEEWAAAFAPDACESLIIRFDDDSAATANPALQPTASGRA